MDVEDISLNIHTAIPCGLILNEIVSNSLKHAFPTGKGGEIEVSLHQIPDNKFLLTIKDNGTGFPEELDFRDAETLGMQLVTMLVNQLDGSIELERKEGTACRIVFSELKYKQRI
jgi:two-component sensor histidine kinase